MRVRALVVLAALLAAGCASSPRMRSHAALAAERPTLHTVGLAPPIVRVYHLPASHRAELRDEWSTAAVAIVHDAFVEEFGGPRAVASLSADDPGLGEVLDLFAVTDFSVRRHAYKTPEEFPEKRDTFDWTLGPCADWMTTRGVDAVWIVHATNLLPTAGAKFVEGLAVTLAVLGALGGAGSNPNLPSRLEVHAALVDRAGRLLYYDVLGVKDVPSPAEGDADEGHGDPRDLRDPRYARAVVHALHERFLAATGR